MKNIVKLMTIVVALNMNQISLTSQNKINRMYLANAGVTNEFKIKHFDNFTYFIAGPNFVKIDANLNIVWSVALSTSEIIKDFELIPPMTSTLYPQKGFYLVGESGNSSSTADNKSFITRVKDSDGTIEFSNYFDHTGHESFDNIILHPNALNNLYKYYINGKNNTSYPTNNQNSFSFQTFLYNLDSDGNINWKKYYSPSTQAATAGQQSQFNFGIIPKNNGNVILCGSDMDLVPTNIITSFNKGCLVEINGLNGNHISSKNIGNTNHKFLTGRQDGNFYTFIGLAKNGSTNIDGSIFRTDFNSVSNNTLVTDISSGFSSMVVIGNDLYTIANKVSTGSTANYLFKISNYNSSNPTVTTVTIGDQFFYNLRSPFITKDNLNNLIICGFHQANPAVFFLIGKIDVGLNVNNNYCIYNTTKSTTSPTNNLNNYNFLNNIVSSNVSIGPISSISSLNQQIYCGQPCIESVDFNYTPTSCNSASFTPTIIGSSVGPFTYSWDFECDGDIDNTIQNPSYTFPPSGTYCVILTVRDAMNVECFGTITKNITISNLNVDFSFTNTCKLANFTPIVSGGTGPYTYQWDFNCTAPHESTMQNPSFNFSSLGTKCVSLKVTDASGICMGFMQKNIVVLDNVAPTINCPSNMILTTNPEVCYATAGGVSATDNCDMNPSITCVLTGATTGTFTNTPQIQYNKGVTTVICTATDDSGNVSSSCTFTVTVFDSSTPQIECPDHITINALACDNSAAATFPPPTIYDNCPMWSYTCDYMSGDLFPCGNTIVTCTVTDMGGAIESCSFSVNVVCSNNCPETTGTTLECGTATNTYNYSVTIENPNPNSNVCTYTLSLPSSQGIVNTSNLITNGNITTISGNLTPANNAISAFNLSIVASCTCNGNQQQTCNLSAILNNIEALPAPPQIICPPSITINTTLDECYSFYEDVSATDNCDPNPSITCILSGATIGVFTNVSSIQYNVGITLVECVATDIDGATDQCSFTVTVLDEQLPTIECPSNVSTQVTDCSNSAMVVFPPPVVSDNCPMPQYTCSHQSNDIFNCGNTLVTCTATDMAGNTATCNFEVDVACNCVDVLSSAIKCDETTHTYEFTINIVNNSGAGSSCTSVLSLDPAQGVILNQTTIWNGTSGTITGSIEPTLVAPFTFNLSLVSDCTCANGLSQNCTVDILYPITEVCNDFVIFDKIYGDTSNNIASGIKAFGDGIYLASKKKIGDKDFAILTKFNRLSGLLIWERQFDIGTDEYFLGPINDFEYVPDNQSTANIDDALLIVGNKITGVFTIPTSPPTVLNDYGSYLLKIECQTGNTIFYNQYPFTGRTSFNKIIKHSDAVDPMFPYYILGTKNPGLPSTLDRIFLLNIDKNGTIIFGREYNSAVAPPVFDDEFGRGLVPLNNGNLLLLGNDVPNGDGVIIQVEGSAGTSLNGIIQGIGNVQEFDILDGIQVNDTTIILVGEKFDSKHGFISIYNYNSQNFNLSHLQSAEFGYISRFRNIHMDAYNNLYVIGQNNQGLPTSDHPVVYSFNINQARNFNSRFSKFLHDNNELDYTEGFIDVLPEADRIYYVDSRLNTSNNFGQFDILVGAYDLDLSNICQDTFINKISRIQVPTSLHTVNSFPLIIPTPSHSINTFPLTYLCDDFCGPNCNITAAFEAVPITCNDMQFNDLSSGGTAPYTYAWDFDCISPAESTSQNPTWTFPGAGTFTVCLTVTDATGLCSSSTMQTVIVPPDTTDPDLICPPDITLNTDINQCYATYGGVSVTDICDTSPDIVCTLTGATSGTFTNQGQIQYNKGVTVVTCTATDDSGNTVSCSFMVTVEDHQFPTIICPQNMVVSAPFCDGGANVTFNPSLISDNCPMASYTCTHASGDFFPCGTTIVTCTVTDMFGNTNSCSFNITVNCTCAQITQAEITCGTLPDTYDFVITVENLSGNGTSCNLSLILDPAQGNITNLVIFPTGNMSEISGTITPSGTIPDFFNFTVLSECICPNGTKINCTLPFELESICCKSAFLTDDEMCKEAASHTITLGFNGSVTSITHVNWYISFSNPCPTDRLDPSWQLYASVNQNSASVDVYPPYLSGDFCMYAVVSLTDNPCSELTSDIAHFILCDFVECTLPSQEYCYTGTPVTPAPILLSAGNAHCNFDIEWLDQNGNPILGSTNQSSYQPPPIIWTAPLTDCKQVFNYSAQVKGPCGPETCSTTITLYNDNAPTGMIEIDPFEVTPICQGEDLTLRFEPICPEEPQPVTWKWLRGNTQATLGHVLQLGDMNPLVNTNALYQDIWYGVEIQNGICPAKITDLFIDVINPLKLLSFNASHISPCRNNGVSLDITYGSDVCPITVKWYKDGLLIHTMLNVTGGIASYNYYNPALNGNYSGNYSVIIESTCCPDQIRKSKVISLEEPLILLVSGPCFRCNDDLVLLEATVLNTNGVICSYQWYELIGTSYIVMGGETAPSLILNRPGSFKVIVQCGICTLEQEFAFGQCGTTSTDDLLTGQIKVLPNPTSGDLILHSNVKFDNSWRLQIYNSLGEIVKKYKLREGEIEMFLSLNDFPNGIYYIQVSGQGKILWTHKVIKLN